MNEKSAFSVDFPSQDSGAIEGAIPPMESTAARATIDERKQRRGRPSKSEKRAFTFEDADVAERAKALDLIFDEKAWKGAVGAPGDAAFALTGKEYWQLSEEEKDTLAKTGAATARAFLITDPRWLALSLFSLSILSIYGSRLMKHVAEKNAEKKKNEPAQA